MDARIPQSSLYRRRPPRTPAHSPFHRLITWLQCFVVAVVLAPSVLGQAVNTTLFLPSTTSFNLSDAASTTFFLASPNSSFLSLSVSLSLCSIPDSLLSPTSSFTLPTTLSTALYVSTDSSNPSPGPDNSPSSSEGGTALLTYGWGSVTLDATTATDGVWISVYAPDGAQLLVDAPGDLNGTEADVVSGEWGFELDIRGSGVSIDDGGAGGRDWLVNGSVGLRFEDSDASSVLLSSANFTAAGESGAAPDWSSFIAETTPLSLALSRSRCFVKKMQAAAAVEKGRNTTTGTTTRGYGGGTRSQFEVGGLQGGTNYTAWLVQNETLTGDGGGNATSVWDPVFFVTKTSDSCRLIYDLDFCPNVAYAVPSPPSLSATDLISYFNASLSPSIAAFARTLTTFPCDVPTMGQYSVISTCSDCLAAYSNWICASTIPRCTDAPSNATLNDTTTSSLDGFASWTVPVEAQTTLLRDDPFASRTPAFGPQNLSTTFPQLFNTSFPSSSTSNLLASSPFPYSEVPPCTDTCNLVQARCPPFLEWYCPAMTPEGGLTGTAGYGMTVGVQEGERMAGDLSGSSRTERAGDRFGNVYCNALGTDLQSAAQFVEISTSSASPLFLSSASAALVVPSFLVALLAFAST